MENPVYRGDPPAYTASPFPHGRQGSFSGMSISSASISNLQNSRLDVVYGAHASSSMEAGPLPEKYLRPELMAGNTSKEPLGKSTYPTQYAQ